jgi:hypothetical protein
MEERGNKTIICSVFFLDIVEYSKKSVAGQISLKERFNAFLSTAIRDVPSNDRIILDTGDGAAISFLGDVEDALRAALSMRTSLLSEESFIEPPLRVRMGVNLGPVRLVKDINGQPNIVGDGINVAQRVMGFAEPGQILVSRSYYDAASRLSQEYAGMFHFEGSRTDKHVREHEVYAIGHPGDFTASQQANGAAAEATKAQLGFRARCQFFWDALRARYNALVMYIREEFKRASTRKKTLYIGLVATPVILLLLLVIKLAHKQEAPPKELANVTEVNSLAPVDAAKTAISPASSVPVATATHGTTAHDHKTDSPHKLKTSHDGKEVSATSKSQATVSLTVKPWGEVYLDGKWVDVSPPLTKLHVPIGVHVIELRNTTFPVYKQTIKANAGDKLSINHKFAN